MLESTIAMIIRNFSRNCYTSTTKESFISIKLLNNGNRNTTIHILLITIN